MPEEDEPQRNLKAIAKVPQHVKDGQVQSSYTARTNRMGCMAITNFHLLFNSRSLSSP